MMLCCPEDEFVAGVVDLGGSAGGERLRGCKRGSRYEVDAEGRRS